GRSGLEWLAGAAVPPQAVLLDLRMPGIDGFEVLRRYRAQGGLAPVIALSAMDDKESVVKAMRLGASDYLVKPIEPDELREAIERTMPEPGPRRGKPFGKINCAALPSELLESELFGHERGAFTGATSEKPGKFELADKGTIFLDEIGEMHPALQAKLLQVLQDEEYYRVGGKRPLRADARVVVATNRVLEDEIARGNFREDLYYRLNVVSVLVPPLRERKEDI